jgi:Domain of unknown function (DUF4397)
MFRKLFLPIAALCALTTIGSLTGCSDDDDNPTAPPTQARFMAIHTSPDAPAVDLLVDGTMTDSALVFANNTDYMSVSAGTRNIQFNATGTGNALIDADFPLQAGVSYSLFTTGAVSSIGTLVLRDTLDTPPAGQARVRFVHLSPDAPGVDIAVAGGTGSLASDVTFRETTSFMAMPSGTYNLELRALGTTTVILAINGVTLQAGRNYTVFVRGFVTGTGNQALGTGMIVNS